MHIIVWVLGAISGFILWNKIKWLAILVIILAISYSVNPLEQKRFKEKGSYDNITATRLGITFALVIGIFVFSLFKIGSHSNKIISSSNNINNSINYNNGYSYQKIPINTNTNYTNNNIVSDISKLQKIKCPEDYSSDEERNNELKEYLSNYIREYPNNTVSDIFDSRYSFLVENNCSKTLEYIKNQANGEDPRTSYIKKNVTDLNNTLSKSNINNLSEEDKNCEKLHGPSVYKTNPQSLGGGAYCDCKPGYTLKLTKLSDGTPSSWCFPN